MLVLVCLLPLTGCSKKLSTADLLIGTWVTEQGNRVRFMKDASAAMSANDGYKLTYKLSQDERTIDILADGKPTIQWQITSISTTELHVIHDGKQFIFRHSHDEPTN